MTCNDVQQQIVEEFNALENFEARFRYMVRLGRSLPPFPEEKKTPERTLVSCQTVIWHDVNFVDGKLEFECYSDSMQMRGIIAMLMRIYSSRSPQEILDSPPNFVQQLDMDAFKSANHTTGLEDLLAQIQRYAEQYRQAA